MEYRKTLLYNAAQLPAYWRDGRRVRRSLRADLRRIAYGPGRRQYFLLAEPADRALTDDLPWAFYLHGGAWTFGTPEAFVAAARPWLDRGFRVVLPSYRRPPVHGLHDIMRDMGAVAGAVLREAVRSGRPVTAPPQLAGISAGGQLAAWLGLHPDLWRRAGWPFPPDRVCCFAAPLDLSLLRPRLLWDRYAAYSPVALLEERGSAARWLLVQGTHDALVDQRHAARFLARATPRQVDCRLIPLPGGTHLDAGRWAHEWDERVSPALARFIAE